jgi:pimeloyl-ACP methyl ester carboxylesterase
MAPIVHKGIKLAYDDRGAGKSAFVCVHGWTCDRSFFATQAEDFARRHRVVPVDCAGMWRATRPRGRIRL